MDLWLGRLEGPGHTLDPHEQLTLHSLSSDRVARPSWTKTDFCHLLPRMWPGTFPHRQRNSTQDQRCYARTFCHPVPGLEHNSSSSYNGPPGLQHGESSARASRLEQGALRAPHTGKLRLDELDEVSRRTLEGLRNRLNMDFNYLIICTHCDLMI